MKGEGLGWPVVAFLSVVAIIFLPPACGACDVDPDLAEPTFTALGFTHVQLGDHAWSTCAQTYRYSNHFTAVSAQGKHVAGTVCCTGRSCMLEFDK